MTNKPYGEFIGVKRIVKGIKYEDTNMITGEPIMMGNGEILWDITEDRDCPFFVIHYKKAEPLEYTH